MASGIDCAACGFANPENARFCAGCGVKLAARCAACGGETLEGAAFCHHCGATIGAGVAPRAAEVAPVSAPEVPPPPPQREPPPASAAELRHVTVVFVDIVDSTGLSQRMDLEAYRGLLAAFRIFVDRLAPEYDGHVAQFMGDGAMIFFGYPLAREDAVACSIHCGLDLVRGAADLGGALAKDLPPVGLRVTINTGSVVVDESARADGSFSKDVFGDVPNIAERLKIAAAPGDVVVSAATRRLVARAFRFADLGERSLKGVEGPVRAFRVEGAASSRDAWETRDAAIVGRGAELALLDQRWTSAVEGDGQVVLLSGEAGIGKSSLVRFLRDRIATQARREIVFAGATIRQNSAYHTLREAFERLAGVEEADDAAARRGRIADFLAAESLDPAAFSPALERLLDCAESNGESGEAARRALSQTLIALLAALGAERPLLILAEDLHWVDPSSIDFLTELATATDGRNWLLVATFRPDFAPPWPTRPNMTALTIGRLSRRDTLRLIEATAGKPVPAEVVEQIVERTDGVPLFVEELTKTVLESGLMRDAGDRFALDGPLPPLSIPESLQDSLMARLDRLAAVKDVAQIAAAIGRRFPLELLRRVSGRVDAVLDEALAKLTDAELIFRLRTHPDAEFEFKHALVQDAAYQSLLRSARQDWHARIGSTIERDFPQIAAEEPEILAHHWTEARDFARGEARWTEAGRIALERSANLEAIDHFRRALACLAEQPQDAERDRRELDLLISLAVPLASSRGYADAQVRETYARAEALSAALGEDARLFPIVYGMFRSWMIGGDQHSAVDAARRLEAIAGATGDPGHRAAADRALGSALFYRGELAAAMPHLEAVENADLTDAVRRAALAYDVVDLKVTGPAYMAWALWAVGRADAARADAARAIERADATGHLFSRALARAFASWTHDFCGDAERSRATAEDVLKLSRDNGFVFWVGWAEVMAAAAAGGADAPECIDRGIEDGLSTGSAVGLSYFLWLKARALLDAAAPEGAAAALDAAEADIARSGEGWWRPEVLRLRARIETDPTRAAALLDDALGAARAMEAAAFALRAATDRMALTGDAGLDLPALLARVEAGGVTADTAEARFLIDNGARRLAGGRP
jgi:class 3 adenylate cyclase